MTASSEEFQAFKQHWRSRKEIPYAGPLVDEIQGLPEGGGNLATSRCIVALDKGREHEYVWGLLSRRYSTSHQHQCPGMCTVYLIFLFRAARLPPSQVCWPHAHFSADQPKGEPIVLTRGCLPFLARPARPDSVASGPLRGP
jgi:hypothetical protein